MSPFPEDVPLEELAPSRVVTGMPVLKEHDDEEEDQDPSYHEDAKTTKELAAKAERRNLGRSESQAICCMRVIVLVAFGLLALITSFTVWSISLYLAVLTYETEFDALAHRIVNSFGEAMHQKLQSVDALSASITAHALEANETFPFVTIPYFDILGANARLSGDQAMAFYLPYIAEESREDWENYTSFNAPHYRDAYRRERTMRIRQDRKFQTGRPELEGDGFDALEEGDLDFVETEQGESQVSDRIWFPGTEEEDLEGPYFPVWHFSPRTYKRGWIALLPMLHSLTLSSSV